MKKSICIILVSLTLGVILYACANTKSVAKVHPVEVTGLVNCGE